MDSPPMRQDPATPRFTEQFHPSPPYQQYIPDSPPTPYYDASPRQPSYQKKDMSPELGSPGLQSVWEDEGLKEVVTPRVEPEPREFPQQWRGHQPEPEERQQRRICGMNRKWFCVLLAVIVVVALGVGLGVGLGLGLSHNKSSSSGSSSGSSTTTDASQYAIGGAISPSYYSKSGAFNGSGIALASQSFAHDISNGTQGNIVMYFQHHTGEIRWMQLNNDGDWVGGDVSTIVAADAKNNTPLSAVAYSVGGQDTWHIFYIDTNNVIKQRTNSNVTNYWADGPIDDLALKANDADQVGMQACWYGSDYGDSDYQHTPLPSTGPKSHSNQVGMHMWYASDNNTFQQLGWRDGDAAWTHQGSFPNMNGHAGVGCYSWGPGTVTYVMMVNEQNTAEVWWKDTNTSVTATDAHPINEWVKTSVQIPNTNPSTSLGYTNYFYLQLDDNTINGYNISWAAENTTIPSGSTFVVGDMPGIPGTHLSVTALPNQGGGNSIDVFYQTEGTDVTEWTRDLIGGQWSSVDLPIPNQ